jgi:PIN domain nuclease of toxin-antitoxin system
MRLLLDTHTLVWALTDPDRLSARAAGLIRDVGNLVLVSAASAWEIATKYRLGRLPGSGPLIAGYAAHLAILRAEELPIRSAHALKAGTLSTEHRDRIQEYVCVDEYHRLFAESVLVQELLIVEYSGCFKCPVVVDLRTKTHRKRALLKGDCRAWGKPGRIAAFRTCLKLRPRSRMAV